ncbi:type II toxin-antitoxin system Phd/YefM family antitoxin [Aquidulcibacter paucihalophilus]|uniref:type II toxin-antitoxin system Phd/YefM family antitoxin n=1 Tax=Aquidulcibacter paucihalophilus TaxID=1978549 RepID=UPI000A19272A|nr:type II toxin-antitoxin system prevent-host-death family antitoxin [Aquidulcibacter paucihalophilus]
MQVNILEAKNRLSELVKCAQAGEEVIIANRGKPVMRLVPIEQDDDCQAAPHSGAGLFTWLVSRKPTKAQRDHTQIERDIEDARAAWD